MEDLEGIEAIWLSQFIGENWSAFIAFLEERGQTEEDAQKLSDKLEALGQR